MSNPIRSILEGLMKDAIANRKADDPPQGRQMLLDQAEKALTAYVEEELKGISATLKGYSQHLGGGEHYIFTPTMEQVINRRIAELQKGKQ